MKARITALLCLFILTILSCHRQDDIVSLWSCESSILYLNSMDTCITATCPLSNYSMEFSIRHHDDFTMNGIRFSVEVSTADKVMRDTVIVPLADSLDCWDGTPYIGAYVKKIPIDINLPSTDSARFSITPLLSDAVSGIDWVAFELRKR